MRVKDAILTARPTNYWPLDDLAASSSCHDEMVAHPAMEPLALGRRNRPIGSDGASDLRTCAMHHGFV